MIGTEWSLRAFDDKGAPLWTRSVPSIAWAVNITGDGRLVVAAYGDGTIRWHRMSDGVELLAFMPLADRTNWVGLDARGLLCRHRRRTRHPALARQPRLGCAGRQRPHRRYPGLLPAQPCCRWCCRSWRRRARSGWRCSPSTIARSRLRTHSQVPPGAQLHLLTIGISEYNEDYAKRLRLTYADRDARDLASAIVSTQASLYSRVLPQVLPNQDANKAGILRALETMRTGMERGGGQRSRRGAFLRPRGAGRRQALLAALRGRCARLRSASRRARYRSTSSEAS